MDFVIVRKCLWRAAGAAALACALLPDSGLASAAVLPAEERVEEGPGLNMPTRVSRLRIDLRADPEQGLIRETATVTVSGSGAEPLVFALQEGLLLERARDGGQVLEPYRAGSAITVILDPPLAGERVLTFEIEGRPKRGGGDAVTRERIVLDPGEAWYPTLATTWADADVTVRVPAGWTAVAPGARQGKSEPGRWRWRTARPVRSVAVAAAPGLGLGEAEAVRTPVRLAAPPSGPQAAAVASRLADAMAWFSGALAPYPFDGMNVVLLPGLKGRVRGSGIVVVSAETPLESASDGADLLASQWFGERVAGDGAWIDAFAAWEATVFARDRALPIPSAIARLREAYLSTSAYRDLPLAQVGPGASEEVLRGKGSAAPDMVRLVVGDRATFDAVREIFRAPVGAPWTLRRIREAFEKQAGRGLLRPFSEWFERTGAPDLEAAWRTLPSSTGGYRADVSIRQRRGNYALPVEVVFLAPGEEHRETVEVEDDATAVFYILPFEPVRVDVDPSGRIFGTRRSARADR